MKKFKLFDAWISIILIISFTIISLIKLDGTFIVGYFTVGAWHIISMLVHHFNKWFLNGNSARSMYHKVIFWLAAALGLGILITPLGFVLMMGLLFAAPVLAVIYTCICYNEVYVKMQRPLALLK
ncbi:MAG: hypothetical protein EOP53_13410 [Sphingobacteriales bacterium]|nr:MAG: hypothetical protein EOP53_13410 [Sphingobacteriales bacterium]